MLELVPLQIPGGSELGLILLINVVLAIIIGYLIRGDAESRGANSPLLWAVGMAAASLFLSFLGFILALIIYYLVVVRD